MMVFSAILYTEVSCYSKSHWRIKAAARAKEAASCGGWHIDDAEAPAVAGLRLFCAKQIQQIQTVRRVLTAHGKKADLFQQLLHQIREENLKPQVLRKVHKTFHFPHLPIFFFFSPSLLSHLSQHLQARNSSRSNQSSLVSLASIFRLEEMLIKDQWTETLVVTKAGEKTIYTLNMF